MPKKSRRKYIPRFGLKWLLLFALVASIVFGWFGQYAGRAKRETRVLEEIHLHFPSPTYSFESQIALGEPPPGPKFLRDWFGDNLFGYVESLTLFYDSDGGDTFPKIVGFRQLKHLTVNGQPGLTDLSAVAELKQLQELNLSSCVEVRDISPLTRLPKLEKLSLSLNGFDDHSSITKIPRLKELSIGHPYTAFKDWSWLSDLETLEVLDLSSSRINKLPPLGKLKKLRILNLTHCSRLDSSESVVELANLVELSIGRGTPLQILDKIEQLEKLERLILCPYERLPASELEEIKKRIPMVKVSR